MYLSYSVSAIYFRANIFRIGNQSHNPLVQSKIQSVSRETLSRFSFKNLTITKMFKEIFQQTYSVLYEMLLNHRKCYHLCPNNTKLNSSKFWMRLTVHMLSVTEIRCSSFISLTVMTLHEKLLYISLMYLHNIYGYEQFTSSAYILNFLFLFNASYLDGDPGFQ